MYLKREFLLFCDGMDSPTIFVRLRREQEEVVWKAMTNGAFVQNYENETPFFVRPYLNQSTNWKFCPCPFTPQLLKASISST